MADRDRDRLVAWAQMMVSMLEEAELWDDIYIAIAAHLTLREIFSGLIERALITEEEARELGIHPEVVKPSFSVASAQYRPSNVLHLRFT